SQIAQTVDMGQLAEGAEIPYPGTCRDRALPLDAPGTGVRVVLPPGAEGFDDLRLGPQVQVPATQCGDLLLRDATGNWTYQFAVTVDDLRHDISLVIRGEDLLDSTGRQILLGRLLGRLAAAQFLHHPLINNPEGKKLSKRDDALSLRAMREGGATPHQILEGAARRSELPVELQWWGGKRYEVRGER
ncbi:MAG: glutamate--tRNA ligase family protein, partial [Gemmatimonadales bacterium]